jgi:hypothetical protein
MSDTPWGAHPMCDAPCCPRFGATAAIVTAAAKFIFSGAL